MYPNPLSPLRWAIDRWTAFQRDQSGSMGVIFALTAMAAAFSFGAAIDYSRALGAKTKLQAAVDHAMLAALQAPAAQRVTQATNVLQASLSNSGITATWSTPPTLNADGSVSGVATAKLATSSLKIARIDEMTMAAQASARLVQQTVQSPANVSFSLTGATGWYWKSVELFTHQPGATSDTLLASYVYQPTNLYNGGTGTTSASFWTGTGGTMVSGPVNTTVSLGSTYDKAYLRMTVLSDGCGPGYAPQHSDFGGNSSYWSPFVCMAVGSTWNSTDRYGRTTTNTVSKTTSPVYYSTNEATSARNLFVNGVALPNNVKPTFFSLFNCGQTTSHDWEDTPWASPLPGSWSQQDIHFTIVSTCAANQNISSVTGPVLAQ